MLTKYEGLNKLLAYIKRGHWVEAKKPIKKSKDMEKLGSILLCPLLNLLNGFLASLDK